MNIVEMGKTAAALARGFGVTLRTMFRKPTTEIFPDGPVKFEARYRGIHVLHRDENGLEKCVACFVCGGVSGAMHLYRGGGECRGEPDFGGGPVREGLQHRLFPVHFLRVLRGIVPDGCDHAWAWV